MNKITNNFGLFRISDRQELKTSHVNQSDNDDLNNTLRTAIEEIEIGTRDSIAIGIEILRRKNIDILPLNQLFELFQSTAPSNREPKFAEGVLKLQKSTIKNLQALLKDHR